ncbi:MAG: polymerase subunit gamma/tau [Frankiales bacterium]|nr:polymerase subunit gamma/tau [Frankiales bacterium]
MSLALYRKYRPGTFSEVIGQEHVTGPLQQAILNGKVHHAYLFSGPRGCGKTSSARILARSLNCYEGPTPNPCGVCDSCVALAPNGPGSLDVIEIDAASHGGVDDARDLRERAFYAPVSSTYKIYIVDEAHMVSREGFNALLKLVEEPPSHLKFIFATTEPEKVIGTIRSRTHHYPFRLVPPRELLGLVQNICAQEDVQVDPLVLPLVVRAGGGSARDALSVLDQLLAGAGPEGLTYARAVALLGFTDAALLDEIIDAFAARDGAAVFEIVDRVVESGHDPRRFAADLLERIRDLLILEAVPDAASKGLLDAPQDQLERMAVQAARLGSAELSRAGDLLNAGLVEMRGTTAPRLMLELICARILLPAAAKDESSMLARLDRLERRLEVEGAPIGAPRPAVSAAQAARPSPSAVTPTAVQAAGQTDSPAAAPVASRPANPQPTASAPSTRPAPVPTPVRATPPVQASSAAWPVAARPGAPAAAERQAAEADQVAAAEAAAPPPAPMSAVEAVAGGSLDAAAVRRLWPDVLDDIKNRRKMTTWALLSQYAQIVEVSGRSLTLSFSTEPIRRQYHSGINEDVLCEALRQVLGIDCRIETVAGGPPDERGQSGDGAATSVPPGGPGAAAPAAHEGFAPGDAAADEDPDEQAEPAPRVDPEEAAVALLSDSLGAKVIGQIDAG